MFLVVDVREQEEIEYEMRQETRERVEYRLIELITKGKVECVV